ncbi:T9SS type A sorting domain-containing protein [Puia sp. P3]|uniref:T9SS type A sorting domain-containing protein n=1 Tax=Puia sp. P3 TaxID=3423952 RepID=UPI003D66EC4C
MSQAPLLMAILYVISSLTPKFIQAQCPGGSVAMSSTYSNSMSSGGTTVYTFTMPQFNPSPGGYTFLSAVLSSTATTGTTISYQNTTAFFQDFFPSVSRTDNVKVNGSTAVNRNNEYDFDETMLTAQGTPTDNATNGPMNTFDNSNLFTTTITNPTTLTNVYQGSGNLNISYTSTFFTNNFIPTGVTVSPTLSDNITFSVTYNFCNPTTLSSNILNFTAEKESNQKVDLKWITANEQPGRKYYIEVALPGQEFAITGSTPSDASMNDASYLYVYSVPPTATGRIYFRLRQIETDGTATWSEVRSVDLDGSGGGGAFSIYPNPPSDFINLAIPGDAQDWQIDIFAADGSLVQRNYYLNQNSIRVNFVRRLSAGSYFVRATNPQSGKHYTSSFVIR